MKILTSNHQSSVRLIINMGLILIQLIIIGIVVFRFSKYAFIAYWVIQAIAILVVLNIIYRKKSASYKISWIIFIFVLPEVGILLYLIWGEHRVSKKT